MDNLAAELEKLVIYAKDRNEITLDDVERVTGGDVDASAFEFTDALGEKNFPRAIEILNALAKEGNEVMQILGIILWYLRRIDRAKQMLGSGKSKNEVGRELRVNSYFLGDFIKQVKDFSDEEIRRASRILLETDLSIKNGRLKPDLALELAVVKLCT